MAPPDPVLAYPVLAYPVLAYPVLAYPVLAHPVLAHPVLAHPVLAYRAPADPARAAAPVPAPQPGAQLLPARWRRRRP